MLIPKKIVYLKPNQIITPEPPTRQADNEYRLNSLAVSVAANGIIAPLAVHRDISGKYILISGRRRLAAARLVGLRRVPCIVYCADSLQSEIFALVENLQRARLHYFEEALAIDRILHTYRISDSSLAAQLGLSTPALAAKLRLLSLSEKLRHRITAAGLPEPCANSLLRLPEIERDTALDRIINEDMNTRQVERYIDSLLFPDDLPTTVSLAHVPELPVAPIQAEPVRKTAIGDEKLFSNSLGKLVSTMQNSGINVNLKRYETDNFTEYKIRIIKSPHETGEQLAIEC